jgi:hypothetical protein
MIRDSRFHCGRDPQSAVNPHEVVPCEMQTERGPQILCSNLTSIPLPLSSTSSSVDTRTSLATQNVVVSNM